jgi:hypothetical protein
MATQWDTFPIELSGGLVSNLSRLQQGLKQPGSARVLQNFEPSIKGGYRRINGFTKYDGAAVPAYGSVVTQGSGQTGTILFVSDVHETPVINDTFTIAGVTGTYTVSSVSFSSANKTATLTVSPALGSSPADKAALTFTLGQSRIEGVYYSSVESTAYVLRGGTVWTSDTSGWTKVSTPDYGSPLVNAGSQTGTTLAVDALGSDTYKPQIGDTFSIAGVELVYTVTAVPSVSSGAGDLAITPALDTSPADNAALTFLSSSHSGGVKARFTRFNFDGTPKVVMVDNTNNPAVFTLSSYKTLQTSSDVTGASFVEEFKDHLFFSKASLVTYTAPFNENDFTAGNGAGNYRLTSPCSGLITFREQLINFSTTDIRKLQGSSLADFALTSVTRDTGCILGDTVQEVGGDILFLGPDGVRFLGATARIGDFNLSLASRQIQTDFSSFIDTSSDYCTAVIREKNQYRLFKYKKVTAKETSPAFVGVQFADQDGQSINWSSLEGIKAYRASSTYAAGVEVSLFSNDDEYLYTMESGDTFDGVSIPSRLYTPYMAITDPSIRKTAYKATTYFDTEGTVLGTLSLKYDFNQPGKIQPNPLALLGGGTFAYYGSATYGSSIYGGQPDTRIDMLTVGSFFTISLQYEFEGGAPFVLDTVMLEFSTEDRK